MQVGLPIAVKAAPNNAFHSDGPRFARPAGERAGQYSIRINDQWRLCFRWTAAGAEDVEIVDYH